LQRITRKDSTYRSGRSPDWLKMKNSDAPAVKQRRGGRMGQKETEVTSVCKNRIMSTARRLMAYVIEFKTATGEALAISIPRTEAVAIRHFPRTHALAGGHRRSIRSGRDVEEYAVVSAVVTDKIKRGTLLSSQATASSSMMQERERSRANASTISGRTL
jgi:hypothetical protein